MGVYVSNYYDNLTSKSDYVPSYCYFDLMSDGTARLVGLPEPSNFLYRNEGTIFVRESVYYPFNIGTTTTPNIIYKEYKIKEIGDGERYLKNFDKIESPFNFRFTSNLKKLIINDNAFNTDGNIKSGLTNVTFYGSTIQKIGNNAFRRAGSKSGVLALTAHDEFSIGDYAFLSSLFRAIDIINRSSKVNFSCGKGSFKNCSSTRTSTETLFENINRTLPNECCQNCRLLDTTSISLYGDDLERIGADALNAAITYYIEVHLDIGRKVNNIPKPINLEARAFMSCTGLFKVITPTSRSGNYLCKLNLGNQTFANCPKLTSINAITS